ncbi:MAG TPA: Hsp70 family protein [Phycisphaerae bacterium]|nr:Hsp70 family protein [Phycisphaerae bacterium]
MARPRGRIVGIDLGTTYSALAYLDAHGQPVTVENHDGELVTPSVVQILPNRKILVGREALARASERPDCTALDFKRDMGEKFYRQPVGGKELSPEALSALVLKQLVIDARPTIGDVREAVITVPAYFGDNRRKATEDAGRIAGLKVAGVLNEPTAAALADAFRQYLDRGGEAARLDLAAVATTAPTTTLVFDLGGGTFDVTVIRIDSSNFEVLATGGEVRLGGVDWDQRLLAFVADEFGRRFGPDPRDDPGTALRFRATCELAKRSLSVRDQTTVIVEHMGRKLHMPVTRGQFEELTADLLTRTQLSTEMLLEDAMLTWDRIDEILLVGGSTRMPMVHDMLERISGKRPTMASAPDQIVAHGAAIHAAILALDRDQAAVSVPVDGARDADDQAVKVIDDDDDDVRQDGFDESVLAAARNIKLQNVNAHSLGVVVRASREHRIVNSPIIPRNTPLPTTRTKVFGTEAPDQWMVRLRIVEGESREPTACTQIGECVIRNLPPGLPQGAPVEVTFRYDPSGRLHVKAIELTHQTTAETEIERESGFQPTELDHMARSVTRLMEKDE